MCRRLSVLPNEETKTVLSELDLGATVHRTLEASTSISTWCVVKNNEACGDSAGFVLQQSMVRHELASKNAKLVQYGKRVWGVDTAEAAIAKTEAFFASINMPTRFSAYGIDANEAATKIAARFQGRGVSFGENGDIDGPATASILRSRA